MYNGICCAWAKDKYNLNIIYNIVKVRPIRVPPVIDSLTQCHA